MPDKKYGGWILRDDKMEEYITRSEHEEFLRRYDGDKSRTDKRLEVAEAKLSDVQTTQAEIKAINVNIEQILRTLEKQEARMKVLEDRDGEKWRGVIANVIYIIIGVVIGAISTGIGL